MEQRPACTYVGTGTPTVSITQATATSSRNASIDEPLYNDATQSSAGGTLLHTSHTTYDSLGKVATSTDQYGGVTTYTYDSQGNLIQTVYPDATQTLSVYDDQSRVIWQTDRSPIGAGDVLGTLTDYDSQGNVIATKRYQNVVISIADATVDGMSVPAASLASAGSLISTTQNWYDQQGRVIETESPSGLRTGTIYYPDGTVQFTGPLNSNAVDGGETTTDSNGDQSIGFALSDFASYTSYTYDEPVSGESESVDTVTDAKGHWTQTYTDSAGRTTNVVYADGSFAQTLYGTDAAPVTAASSGLDLTVPAGVTIPAGGTQTVSVGQRKDGDPVEATFDIYNAAGQLTDVFLPAVTDGNPNDAAFNQSVAPHWSYTYDASGNEISQTDPNGHTTTFAYDENGNQVSRTLPDGEKEEMTYNAYGQMLTHTDFDGNVATYSYYSDYAPGHYAGSLQQVAYTAAAGSGERGTGTGALIKNRSRPGFTLHVPVSRFREDQSWITERRKTNRRNRPQ